MSEFKGVGVNPELPAILIITVILLLGGVAIIHFEKFSYFNFYSSNIVVNGENIQEELHFLTNKNYHTLFRNFENEIYSESNPSISSKNYISFHSVNCSEGTPYVRDYNGQCYFSPEEIVGCVAYIENNEYGCTFGENLGFLKGKEYIVNSEYKLHPENLFKINNAYYIKFVVYSPKNHIKLTEKNFIVSGNAVRAKIYFPDQNVILYIPYAGDRTGFNIIAQNNFEFDSDFKSILKYLLAFFPGIIFFLIWFVWGKENTYEETPRELSTFPTKRKFWEVSAYFNPPFLKIDKNLFAAILLNFYNKKIIDVKENDKDIYIKLNKFNGDSIESQIYSILEKGKEGLKDRIFKRNTFDGEYFNLKKAMGDKSLAGDFISLRDDIKNVGKEYLYDRSGIIFLFVVLYGFLGYFFNSFFNLWNKDIDIFPIIFFVVYIFIIVVTRGTLFSKFKGEYYIEYQRWKAFKRYLKNSFSIKSATYKGTVIWNDYLIYATALGVPDKVIKELRAYNLIDESQMNVYNGIILGASSSFSSVGASSVGGGGFGGAGGGGVGGGGGGGR